VAPEQHFSAQAPWSHRAERGSDVTAVVDHDTARCTTARTLGGRSKCCSGATTCFLATQHLS